MNEQKKKSKVGKIVKGILAITGGATAVGCVVYVVNEVKKEYDSTVAENNRLRAFINDHEFYEKQQTNFRSTDYDEGVNNSEEKTSDEPQKFDRNNPIYKQSPITMRKLGLNPDGTVKSKSKSQFVKIDEYLSSSGYVVEVMEDVPTGLKIHKPTNRTVLSKDETKEDISYGNS